MGVPQFADEVEEGEQAQEGKQGQEGSAQDFLET